MIWLESNRNGDHLVEPVMNVVFDGRTGPASLSPITSTARRRLKGHERSVGWLRDLVPSPPAPDQDHRLRGPYGAEGILNDLTIRAALRKSAATCAQGSLPIDTGGRRASGQAPV